MDITVEIDDQVVARVQKVAEATGKTLDQLVEDYLQTVLSGNDVKNSREESPIRNLSCAQLWRSTI